MKSRKKIGRSKNISKPSKMPSRERCIFKFWDGEKTRFCDPMEVQLSFTTRDNFNLETDMKISGSTLVPEKEATLALHRVIDATRDAFKVKKFEDGGLTAGECWQLLLDFASFILDLKKKLGTLQTSAPSDAPQPDLSPTQKKSGSSDIELESSQPEPLSTRQV